MVISDRGINEISEKWILPPVERTQHWTAADCADTFPLLGLVLVGVGCDSNPYNENRSLGVYSSVSSRETEPMGWRFIYNYYEEVADRIIEAEKSAVCHLQAGDSGKPVELLSEFEGPRARGADGASPRAETGDDEMRNRRSISEAGNRVNCSSLCLLFYSGPRWIGGCPPALGVGAIYFPESTSANLRGSRSTKLSHCWEPHYISLHLLLTCVTGGRVFPTLSSQPSALRASAPSLPP